MTVERGFSGKEKRVDTSVVTRMCRDAYRFGDLPRDRITRVAGDGGYQPTLRRLVPDGFQVTVLYWSYACRNLRKAATASCRLDSYLAEVRCGEGGMAG